VIKRTIELGGHVKTGLELFYDPARNPTTWSCSRKCRPSPRKYGRPLATHQEAREIYGIAEQAARGAEQIARRGTFERA
jgi:hypothetical protein